MLRLLMILLIALVSCHSFDHTIERCTIDTTNWQCYCHDYRLCNYCAEDGGPFIGRVSETIIYDIDYCDKIIGFKDYDVIYEALLRDLNPRNK